MVEHQLRRRQQLRENDVACVAGDIFSLVIELPKSQKSGGLFDVNDALIQFSSEVPVINLQVAPLFVSVFFHAPWQQIPQLFCEAKKIS